MKAFLLSTMTNQANYYSVIDDDVFKGFKLCFLKCLITDDKQKHKNYYRENKLASQLSNVHGKITYNFKHLIK